MQNTTQPQTSQPTLQSVRSEPGYYTGKVPLGAASPLDLTTKEQLRKKHIKPSRCPNPVGFLEGVKYIEKHRAKAIRTPLRCNSWQCPYCGPRKKKQLKARIYRGQINSQEHKKGFRKNPYAVKMLTLTAPGRSWRYRKSISDAYDTMSAHYSNLIDSLRKAYGTQFQYFRIVEPQQDGYPHFHVLLVGDSIAPKSIKADIERLWCGKYGMGFIKLNVMTRGIKGGINYAMKYMTKDIKPIRPGGRIFTTSKGALEPKFKEGAWLEKRVMIGFGYCREDSLGNPIVEEIDLTISGIEENWPLWEHYTEELREKIQEETFWQNIEQQLSGMGFWIQESR